MFNNKFLNIFKEALISLWHTRDELSFHNIRKSHLHYSLALVFCLTLADLQLSFFITEHQIMGFDSITLMNIAYSLAAAVILFISAKGFKLYFQISSITVVIGFLAWLLFPGGEIKLVLSMVCWMGLGGCAACSTYAYAFVLNNAERLLGIMAITFNSGLLIYLYEMGITNVFLEKILPSFLILAIVGCLFLFKSKDFPDTNPKKKKPAPLGSIMVLICVVIFFSLNIFGEGMLRAGNGRTLFALGMVASILFSFLIQLVFQRSVWHIWNFFLALSTLGTILMAVSNSDTLFRIGAFIFGVAMGAGYIVIFYWAGGLVKKSGNMAFFKLAMFSAVVVTMIPITISGVLASLWPEALSIITPFWAIVSLLLFTLFSPAFYKSLFENEAMGDFHKIDMSGEYERFNGLGLTPREKEVCTLLLEGYTLRQISGIIGIGYPTVNTYCTSLYRKMSINSRTELFLRFGVSTKA